MRPWMQLPGRLRSTTLGDLLGALHRGQVTGTLELTEDRGRSHHIHWVKGLVAAVEIDGASPSLAEVLRGDGAGDDDLIRGSLLRAIASRRLHGEVLIDEYRVSPSRVGSALRHQMLKRLAMLERLADARLAFRVAVRPPRSALVGTGEIPRHSASEPGAIGPSTWNAPLAAREFLHGRRRAREREATRPEVVGAESRASEDSGSAAWAPAQGGRAPSPWHVLGVAPGAELAVIKRAYRRLARTVHPDLHPDADDAARRALQARFARLTDAYRALVP